jgi:hypothetical protein
MKDKWKKFADDHQEEFNEASPEDVFFEKISPRIKSSEGPRLIRLSVVLKIAAAFIVLIGLTIFYLLQQKSDKMESKSLAKNETVKDERLVFAKVNPELAEAEFYYVNQIDQLMEEVENNHLTTEVKEILEQLDAEFDLLKKEMGEQVNSEQIITALMENYRLKIKLLEKLLNSYNSNEKNHEKENHT